MINELSEALRAILDDPQLASVFPELAAAQVVFDRPADQFNPSQTTVDLFLYDLREDMELRSNERIIERRNGQAIIRHPPLRVACSYLLTVWAVGGGELPLLEQKILSQALMVLARHPTIPQAFLSGGLVGQEPPLPMMTARADGLKNPSEFWTAVGNKLKPSITIVVTISLDPFVPQAVPLAITTDVRIGKRSSSGGPGLVAQTIQEFFHVGGQVTDAGGKPLADAVVALKGTSIESATDAEGRFTLGPLAGGAYTLRVQTGQAEKEVNIVVPAASGSNYNVQF